jgi:hypothetical protein
MALDTLAPPPNGHFSFGLTSADVEEFRDILRSECGETLGLEEAWSRAIEMLALCRMLLEPLPDDPSAVQTSSGLVSSAAPTVS